MLEVRICATSHTTRKTVVNYMFLRPSLNIRAPLVRNGNTLHLLICDPPMCRGLNLGTPTIRHACSDSTWQKNATQKYLLYSSKTNLLCVLLDLVEISLFQHRTTS